MPPSEKIREVCAKLLAAKSGPEFEELVDDLDRAIVIFMHASMTELVEEICVEKDTEKKLVLTEQLKRMLDDDLRRRSARAS